MKLQTFVQSRFLARTSQPDGVESLVRRLHIHSKSPDTFHDHFVFSLKFYFAVQVELELEEDKKTED